jgi:hypothetical protein
LSALGERLTRPSLPFSDEAQQLIKKYAPPAPEAERQIREGSLVAIHAALMFPLVVSLGIAAWIGTAVGGDGGRAAVLRVGWALVVGWLAGMTLHLGRYYDALICRRRSAGRTGVEASGARPRRWPRGSSDADFVLELAVSVGVFILGAPK